jgi:hypothetical protein
MKRCFHLTGVRRQHQSTFTLSLGEPVRLSHGLQGLYWEGGERRVRRG